VVLEIDHAPGQSRWKAALRLPLSLPVLIFSAFLQGGTAFAVWVAIVLKGQIPMWLFDYQVAVNRWAARAVGYFLLLTDDYPPFEGEHSVRYDVVNPGRLSRRRVLVWKLITAIPHFIALAALGLTLVVAVPFGWFAVVLTGRYPASLHDHVLGTLRWAARVQAYVLSLTDELPPFSMLAEPGPRHPHANAIAAAIGLTAVAGFVAFAAALFILRPGDIVAEVPYQRLLAGELSPGETRIQVDSGQDDFDYSQTGTVELSAAADPANQLLPLITPESGYRLVEFELAMENQSYPVFEITQSDFRLTDQHGNHHPPLLVLVDGRPPTAEVDQGETASTIVFFEIPNDTTPAELRLRMEHHVHRTLTYIFE
jgi:hypothetical protein